jgi:proteasome lid subunit RPN8/RPN11
MNTESIPTSLRSEHGATAIAAEAIAIIREHGAESFPYECCGALIARNGAIVEAVKLPNTTASGAARRVRIGPDDYRKAESHAQARDGTLVGFYHSHPNESARPSAYDLEHAWPNLIYVIISVRGGTPEEITVWHLREDRAAFDEGELKWPIGS